MSVAAGYRHKVVVIAFFISDSHNNANRGRRHPFGHQRLCGAETVKRLVSIKVLRKSEEVSKLNLPTKNALAHSPCKCRLEPEARTQC